MQSGISFFTPARPIPVSGTLQIFVDDAGNDGNDGLSSSTPWLSIQTAFDRVAQRYQILAGGEIQIRLLAGTYNTTVPFIPRFVYGAGKLTLMGDTGAATDITLNSTASFATTDEFDVSVRTAIITVSNPIGVYFLIKDLSFASDAALGNRALLVYGNSIAHINNVVFTTGNFSTHLWAATGGLIVADGDYTVTGGASTHLYATATGVILIINKTVTVSGTPAFSIFASCASGAGVIYSYGTTWSGAATGKRYSIIENGTASNAGGATHFPGNVAGTVATGGIYA